MSDEIPDVVGTVRGYRTWRLTDGGLESVSADYTWQAGVNEAHCHTLSDEIARLARVYPGRSLRKAGHLVPVKGCSCGFYACQDPYGSQIWASGVHGVIEMSGGIVEHEKNTVVRSGKAEIAALCMSRWDYKKESIKAVRARYPGVKIYGSREKMVAAWPPAIEVTLPEPGKRQNWLPVIAAVDASIGLWNAGVAIETGRPWPGVMAGMMALVTAFLLRRWWRGAR